MPELDPQFIDGIPAPGRALRRAFVGLQPGIFTPGDLAVTAGPGTRELVVAAGEALCPVAEAGVFRPGLASIMLDAPKSSVAFEAGGPGAPSTNPRIDQVAARIWNESGQAGLRKWRLVVVPGAETASLSALSDSAALDARTGAAALPAAHLPIADVVTRPGQTQYPAAAIRDRRSWARGKMTYLLAGAASLLVTGLDGDSDQAYDIEVAGQIAAHAGNRAFVVRPNEVAAGQPGMVRLYRAYAPSSLSSPAYASLASIIGGTDTFPGFALGFSTTNTAGTAVHRITSKMQLLAASGGQRVARTTFGYYGTQPWTELADIVSRWEDTTAVIDRLLFDFPAGFTGRITVRRGG